MKTRLTFITLIFAFILAFNTVSYASILDGKDDIQRQFPIELSDYPGHYQAIYNAINSKITEYPYYQVYYHTRSDGTPVIYILMTKIQVPKMWYDSTRDGGRGRCLFYIGNSSTDIEVAQAACVLTNTPSYTFNVNPTSNMWSGLNVNCILYNNYAFNLYERPSSNQALSYFGVRTLPALDIFVPSADYVDKPTSTLPSMPEAPTTWNVIDWLRYIVDWIKYLPTGFGANIAPLLSPLGKVYSSLFKDNTSIWDLVKSISSVLLNPLHYFITPLVEQLTPLFSGLGNLFDIDTLIERLNPFFGVFDINPFRQFVDLVNLKFAFVQTIQTMYKDLYDILVTNAYTQAPTITFDFSEVNGLVKIPSFDISLNWFLRFKPLTDTVISIWLVINYITSIFFKLPNIINGVSSEVGKEF